MRSSTRSRSTDDDPAVRENRLKLLNEIRAATARGGGFLEDRRLDHWTVRRRAAYDLNAAAFAED